MFKALRKLLIGIIAICLLSGHTWSFADDPIREYRRGLLDKVRKEAKFEHKRQRGQYDNLSVSYKNFIVYIGSESLKEYKLDPGKKVEDLLLRICFVIEEVHQMLTQISDKSPSGYFEIRCYSPKVYEEVWGDSFWVLPSYTGLRMAFDIDDMEDPLDNFTQGLQKLYYYYSYLFFHSIIGADFSEMPSDEIFLYFLELGHRTSRWKQDLTDKEINEIIKEIDEEYILVLKTYPQYFKSKVPDRKTIKCKWCGKEVDVTGRRKGERIQCPHCRNPIFVK